MIGFILVVTLLHLFFCIKKPIYGLCTLLAIKILIPDTARFSQSLSLNSLCSIVLFVTYFAYVLLGKESLSRLRNNLINYILFFIVFSFFVILFTDYTPRGYQIKTLLQYFFLQIAPIVVAVGVIKTGKDLKLILLVFVISFIICTLYGILCFIFGYPYPYNAWFSQYFSVSRNANYEMRVEMAGITGRIIGTATSDSWSFGMVIGIACLIVHIIYTYLKTRLSLICYGLCVIAVLFTVRRSPILTLLCFYLLLYLFNFKYVKKFKKMILCGITIGLFILLLINIVPSLSSFRNIIETVFFFWDDSVAAANRVSGSSVSLRQYQLNYTITHISESLLFGNGWGAMYVKYHPGMHGWESIIFTTLFQSGVLGLFVMGGLFYSFYKYSIIKNPDHGLAKAFIIASLIFCITSDTIYPFYIYFGCVLINKINTIRNKAIRVNRLRVKLKQ